MRKRAVVISVVFFGGTVAATGVEVDTYSFEDIWKPHGRSRSLAEQHAAARACGATGPTLILPAAIPAYKNCMLLTDGGTSHPS